jgi:hypothetical protein
LPECTGEVSEELFTGGTLPIQEDLRCYACSCGELTGGSCSFPYTTYSDSSCQSQTRSATLTPTCEVAQPGPYISFGESFQSGSCTPMGGEESARPGPRWDNEVRGCGLAEPRSAGCGNGSVCMPEPAAPFEDEICVFRTGSHACPTDYPNRHTYSLAMTDERECEPCTCVLSGGCTATITLYDNAQCTNTGAGSSQNIGQRSPGQCEDFNPSISVAAMRLTSAAVPSNCYPNGGRSVGDIQTHDPITVCCR